mgnify:CR=1 FL=1
MEFDSYTEHPSPWEWWYIKPKPFFHSNLGRGIEQLVAEEKPEEAPSLAERIFADKRKTTKATVRALFQDITMREKLDIELLNRIGEDLGTARSYLENIKELTARDYSGELTMNLGRRRGQLEGVVMELEREKRKEYLECWRDLANLKRYLLTALQTYWTLSKRKDVLYDEHNERGGSAEKTEAYHW